MHFHSTFPSTSVTDLKAFAKVGKVSPKAPQTPIFREIFEPLPSQNHQRWNDEGRPFLIPPQKKKSLPRRNKSSIGLQEINNFDSMCSFAERSWLFYHLQHSITSRMNVAPLKVKLKAKLKNKNNKELTKKIDFRLNKQKPTEWQVEMLRYSFLLATLEGSNSLPSASGHSKTPSLICCQLPSLVISESSECKVYCNLASKWHRVMLFVYVVSFNQSSSFIK